jgi:hypothetical protein
MLVGFEDYTHDLTESEKELVPVFVECLRKRIGKASAITNKDMVAAFARQGHSITQPRVRKIVNVIRMADLLPGLIATSDGYYVSYDEMEVAKYIESLKGRIGAINGILHRTIQHYERICKKQMA